MKKVIVLSICSVLLLTGCGTYTGSGAYIGGEFGSILGSAIGGITGGPRGSDVGTIVGMAGGAVVGAVIGNAADQADRREVHDHYEKVQRRKAADSKSQYDYDNYDYGGYDPSNSGDDRLYDFGSADYTGDYSAAAPRTLDPSSSSIEYLSTNYDVNNQIQIKNARFVDDNYDNALSSGETCKVIFEVYNTSQRTIFDIQPTVVESTGRKNIYISPNIHVERLEPGRGIRYTAMVKAGKMKPGTATFCISVLQGNTVMSNVSEFNIPTRK
jgi:uncharacterized protein YcfJ